MFRTNVVLVLLISAATSIQAADPKGKAAELIVGKWVDMSLSVSEKSESGETKTYLRKVIFEFTKTGTVTMTESDIPELKKINPTLAKGRTLEGSFKFVTDDQIEVEWKGFKKKIRTKVAVSDTELVMSDPDGKDADKFKRLKE